MPEYYSLAGPNFPSCPLEISIWARPFQVAGKGVFTHCGVKIETGDTEIFLSSPVVNFPSAVKAEFVIWLARIPNRNKERPNVLDRVEEEKQ